MNADPMERRLAWTCGAVALAATAHLGHAPLWIIGFLYASLAVRLTGARRGWGLPSRWTLVMLVLLVTGAILVSYRTLNGLQAGTALLVAMAALKAQESRSARDHAVLIFIGYFLCLASLLYEASVLRLVHALVTVWLLTAALLGAQRAPDAVLPVSASRLSGRILALGIPLTLVLFVFVPRLEGHFWALPNPSDEAKTGISEEMTPGAIAHLAQSDEPAFRVRFDGPAPSRELRYWRALVLEDFDGRTWRRPNLPSGGPPPQVVVGGTEYRYTVSLEATHQTWLPVLDHLVAWRDVTAQRLHDDTLLNMDPVTATPARIAMLTVFSASSAPAARVSPDALRRSEQARSLRLPNAIAPRARELALRLASDAHDGHTYIERVLGRFRSEPFSYTLDPPPLGSDPVDEFLFETRAGFCEHYASAFTVLMRAAGLPARVVVGFQGGDPNVYGGYLLVRQSHAHAWSEVWFPDEGWVRVDPTAAIAPERIRSGLDGALPSSARRGRSFLNLPWVLKAREAYDAVRAGWNQAVVGFSSAQQASVLDHLGWTGSPVLGLAVGLSVGFAVAGLALYALQHFRRRRATTDRLAQAWARVCGRLAATGWPPELAEGALDYSRRVGRGLPAEAVSIAALADTYLRLRYGPDSTADERDDFIAAARAFRPRPRAAPGMRPR